VGSRDGREMCASSKRWRKVTLDRMPTDAILSKANDLSGDAHDLAHDRHPHTRRRWAPPSPS